MHGYDHVDFRKISRADATSQFTRALEAYRRAGVACDGFRCPYLSFTPELFGDLARGSLLLQQQPGRGVVRGSARRGQPRVRAAREVLRRRQRRRGGVAPEHDGWVVEIPCSVPDDLELFDGLSLGEQGMLAAWLDVLHEVHRRGELVRAALPSESFDLMQGPIEDLLDAAARLQPSVWLTQLRDVARWWQEKSAFAAQASAHTGGLRIELHCTERATVLVRSLAPSGGCESMGLDAVRARRQDGRGRGAHPAVRRRGRRRWCGRSGSSPSSGVHRRRRPERTRVHARAGRCRPEPGRAHPVHRGIGRAADEVLELAVEGQERTLSRRRLRRAAAGATTPGDWSRTGNDRPVLPAVSTPRAQVTCAPPASG